MNIHFTKKHLLAAATMLSLVVKAALLVTLFHGSAKAETAPDANRLVQDADRYRTTDENLQVETQVTVFNRDGSPDKERRYTVLLQSGHRSLVLMRSPAEQGQKVLMLADDFWLLMPGSQRALRITPTQKLLGDASTGDIATLRWSEDYQATLVGEEPCDPAAATSSKCWHLNLAAGRKGASYQRIELWVGKSRHEPVRADLYVQSDKLAKQAVFVLDKPADKPGALVSEMRLTDQLASHKVTAVGYLARSPRSVPEAWLNPMFLARNPSLD
ncbi:MAG: outer membrane lipoprotein-sorting protein [Burkholderiales bacterium]